MLNDSQSNYKCQEQCSSLFVGEICKASAGSWRKHHNILVYLSVKTRRNKVCIDNCWCLTSTSCSVTVELDFWPFTQSSRCWPIYLCAVGVLLWHSKFLNWGRHELSHWLSWCGSQKFHSGNLKISFALNKLTQDWDFYLVVKCSPR